MSYIFYSEIFHLINLRNMPNMIIGMVIYMGIGLLFRYHVPTKKVFYKAAAILICLWVICEIIYPIIFTLDKLELVEIAGICFQLAWILFCIFIGSGGFHLLCRLLHNRKLN